MKSSPQLLKPQEVIRRLQFTELNPGLPAVRQIADHLGHLIRNEKLPFYTRLPPISELAKLWNTTYYSVQLAISSLTAEGLIIKSPRRGSFVAPPQRSIKRVCLYHYSAPNKGWQNNFYTFLNVTLYRLLSQHGIITVPVFDHRPIEQVNRPPDELPKMIRAREVDAVIATALYPYLTHWLFDLQVPIASVFIYRKDHTVGLDSEMMAKQAVEAAHQRHRKSIGYIGPGYAEDALLSALRTEASKLDISVNAPALKRRQNYQHWEHAGSKLTEELLTSNPETDFILVYPDDFLRGVVAALVKREIRVPKEIVLMSHCNAELPIYVPFPMLWLQVKIEDFGSALLDQIYEQAATNTVRPYKIPTRVVADQAIQAAT